MKRWLAPLAVGMALFYAVLAIGAAGCLSLHADPPQSTHHHSQSHVAHSAFCAWACQANSTVHLHIAAPTDVIFAFVGMLSLSSATALTALFATAFRSRAPPR